MKRAKKLSRSWLERRDQERAKPLPRELIKLRLVVRKRPVKP